jgi:phage terminase large subunit-like protein
MPPSPERALLEAEAELYGRQISDPLRTWRPTPRQRPFIQAVLAGTPGMVLFAAANRSGKSSAAAYCGATLARFGMDPPRGAYSSGGALSVWDRAVSGLVVSVTFPNSRDVIQPLYFDNGMVARGAVTPFIPPRECAEWSVTDQLLKLKNGSVITFRSADSGREKFQGLTRDWVHLDEEPPKPIFEEIVARVGAGRGLRVFISATLLPPEGMAGGISWLYEELIRPWQSGTRPDVAVFGASIYDNAQLGRDEIARLEALYPEGSAVRRIRLNGEWLPGLTGARAYPAFDRAVHVRPAPPVTPYLPLLWSWDFNVEPLCSVVAQKIDGTYHVRRELVLEQGSIAEMCERFREAFPRHESEVWVYGDASGRGRPAQTGQSDYTVILQTMKTYPVPLRLKVPEANPLVSMRVNAVNRLLRDEHGQVRVQIDSSCHELITDLEQVLRDGQKIKKTGRRSDPYFRRTHASDALSYCLAFDAPVLGTAGPPRPPVRVKPPAYGFAASAP